MLLRFDRLEDMDFPKLMEIYHESNTENILYFFPECADQETGRRQVEEKFRIYLQDEFFSQPGNRYYVLEDDNTWISAIRLFPVPGQKNRYYAEALETRPDRRRQGYASKLFKELFSELSAGGTFEVLDSVSKENEPSLKLHQSCGFRIYQEDSVCILNGFENPKAYGLKYETEHQGMFRTEV